MHGRHVQNLQDLTTEHPAGHDLLARRGRASARPRGQFSQVIPKDGNVYIGAPGSDHRRPAESTGTPSPAYAERVTIQHLTIQNFGKPRATTTKAW